MSILIVEDNPVNARLLALMLNAQGYNTVVARNGKEGLTVVTETPDIQLIITDYMMPEMDGDAISHSSTRSVVAWRGQLC